MKYPKFEEAIKNNIVNPAINQTKQPGYGLVLDYDPVNNTATIITAKHGTDRPDQLYYNVPCPVSPGVQGVAPEVGRPCWLVFRDPQSPTPMITHFFSFNHLDKDYRDQNQTNNLIPRFMSEI